MLGNIWPLFRLDVSRLYFSFPPFLSTYFSSYDMHAKYRAKPRYTVTKPGRNSEKNTLKCIYPKVILKKKFRGELFDTKKRVIFWDKSLKTSNFIKIIRIFASNSKPKTLKLSPTVHFVLSVCYHCGGWPKEVNSCVLNSYMVYL